MRRSDSESRAASRVHVRTVSCGEARYIRYDYFYLANIATIAVGVFSVVSLCTFSSDSPNVLSSIPQASFGRAYLLPHQYSAFSTAPRHSAHRASSPHSFNAIHLSELIGKRCWRCRGSRLVFLVALEDPTPHPGVRHSVAAVLIHKNIY
ncbi:hypothetical protein B0H13DRAFT_2366682 [Mycena leptocephala]|nr:hypothetical protein B0H13DRAFT_2366682 [Mycena leptocephala]